jgi:hypothetical protein
MDVRKKRMKHDSSNQNENPELNVVFCLFRQKKEFEHNVKFTTNLRSNLCTVTTQTYNVTTQLVY